MFVVDYNQQLVDHGKILILVKNFEPKCPNTLFEQAFQSISKHHPLVYAKHSVSRNVVRRATAESLVSIPMDFQYEPSESPTICMRPIWVRYVREFHSVNQAWATFQAHRAVVGLIGLCSCTTADEVVEVIRTYMEQKALISENPVNGRLFVLIPSSDASHCQLTIEHTDRIIQEEQKRMPQSLLLTPDEILAHPLEQFFNTEFQRTESAERCAATPSAKGSSPGFESADRIFAGCDTTSKATSLPILNPRLAGALVDLTSHICHNLDRVLITADPKAANFLISPVSSAALDASDGDSSDSTFSAVTGSSVSKSTKPIGNTLHPEDHHFISRPYVRSSFNTGSSPNLAALSNDAGFHLFNAIKQRRNSGRWKKHLADLSLQLGEYDLAHLYYEASLQLLRPLMDSLWIAGALEGLSAVAVIRNATQKQPPEGYSSIERSMRYGSRSSEGASAGKSAEFPGHKNLNSSPSATLTPREYRSTALEALELYRKANVDAGFLEETTFKVIRLLIAGQQSSKACELIDYMLRATLEEEKNGVMNLTKKLSTIVNLYLDLGYRRRASFVAWQAFVRNVKLPGEENLSTLFAGLSIRFVPPCSFSQVQWFSFNGSQPAENVSKQVFLRSPAVPANLLPMNTSHKSLWFLGSSGGVRCGTTAHGFLKSNRFVKKLGTKSRTVLKERDIFHPIGWAALQASTIWSVIERLKTELKFDDATDIPWEMTLRLTGFIFSLLDSWPDCLDEAETEACLDSLRRLAVLRSPDQPRLLEPSLSFFTPDVSGNVALRRHGNKTATHVVNGPTLPRSPETLRQLVDLLEVPTHRLPSITSIKLLPLPKFLLPCELSKEALASAAHFSVGVMDGRIPCDVSQSTDSAVIANNSDRPSGLFYYAPIATDEYSQRNFKVVEWVCEEPMAIELLVDNSLPVPLRLSDLGIELSQLFTGPVGCSPTPSTFNTNTPCSPGRATSAPFHLNAVRIAVEKSTIGTRTGLGTRQSTSPSLTAYGVEFNQACLLESAHFKYLHPYMKLDPVWQRRLGHLSCTIPAKSVGNRLVLHVVPSTNMLLLSNNHLDEHESGTRSFYRVSGITYRLVDFGAIHTCVRVPSDMLHLDSSAKPLHEVTATPVRERQLSSSSSSVLSVSSILRSSINCGSDSALNSIRASDFAPQHPTVPLIQNLFIHLPAIRLRAPMPRLCIFPGTTRSAHSLKEAADFLPQLTIPLLRPDGTPMSTASSNDIPSPRFHIPLSEHWSENVATVFHVSVYPYESRWLPLRIFVRDESHPIQSSNQSHLSKLASIRHLNALDVSIKSADNSAQLLQRLNITPDELVKCHNVDSIRHKMPLPIYNERVTTTPVRYINDGVYFEDESILPICATECGLIWLSFHSEAFWRNLSQWFIQSSHKCGEEAKDLSFRNSHAVMLEIQIEYALDAPCKDYYPSNHTLSTQSASEMYAPARRVGIGIHLSLLSSKHSPLLLYYPQLSFRDEPKERNSGEITHKPNSSSENNVYESKAMFSCTLRARLPASLVPQHLRFPGRQYRVRLEVSASWATPDAQVTEPTLAVVTPWTSLFELSSHIPVSTRVNAQSVSPVSADLDSPTSPSMCAGTETFHNLTDLDTTAFGESRLPDYSAYHCHLNLPLEELSKVVFRSGKMQLTHLNELSSGEVGLPLPTNTDVVIRVIESHIWITWKSWLDGRISNSLKTGSTEKLNALLPDSRFYRFGRLCLGAHNAELPAPDQSALNETQTKSAVSKSWYGNAFANSASTAGLLWCHNLHLTVNIPDTPDRSGIREPTLPTMCHRCLNDPSAPRHSLPTVIRRGSQLPESFSSSKPRSTTPQLVQQSNGVDGCIICDSTPDFNIHHRFSMPDLRHPPQLQGVYASLLSSFRCTCAPLLHPIPLRIETCLAYDPMDDLRLKSSDNALISGVITVSIHRVWTGPVVYEIMEKTQTDADGKTRSTTELSPPLVEGKDFGFFGSGGGMVGLKLSKHPCKVRSQASSVVFYRPGHFWICGLLGLLPPKSTIVSADSTSSNTVTLPTPSSLETIRFSGDGLRVHVFHSDKV